MWSNPTQSAGFWIRKTWVQIPILPPNSYGKQVDLSFLVFVIHMQSIDHETILHARKMSGLNKMMHLRKVLRAEDVWLSDTVFAKHAQEPGFNSQSYKKELSRVWHIVDF